MSGDNKIEELSANYCFGGVQKRFSHAARTLDCDMNFSIFLPSASNDNEVPLVYWLSGLTCTDENFVQKAGAQQFAEKHGVAVVAPDTSPRGDHVPDDSEEAWDFGKGAGFYLNATQQPWAHHYHMYDYVTDELPELINAQFPVDATRCAIMGHSMGGHGALTIAFKNISQYSSVSAFSPIVAPTQCPWGEKAFSLYLGDNRDDWQDYDAVELIKKLEFIPPMLVDQGEADGFLDEQLKTHLLVQACADGDHVASINMRPHYDHSYFFIASFIADHIEFHAKHLKA